jgi:hypothetical protein
MTPPLGCPWNVDDRVSYNGYNGYNGTVTARFRIGGGYRLTVRFDQPPRVWERISPHAVLNAGAMEPERPSNPAAHARTDSGPRAARRIESTRYLGSGGSR